MPECVLYPDSTSSMERQPAVYILTNRRNGTLYVGVTTNLLARVHAQHVDLVPGFPRPYGTHRLVYFEMHESILTAISREKQLKRWRRHWKLQLIEDMNPDWQDLWEWIN